MSVLSLFPIHRAQSILVAAEQGPEEHGPGAKGIKRVPGRKSTGIKGIKTNLPADSTIDFVHDSLLKKMKDPAWTPFPPIDDFITAASESSIPGTKRKPHSNIPVVIQLHFIQSPVAGRPLPNLFTPEEQGRASTSMPSLDPKDRTTTRFCHQHPVLKCPRLRLPQMRWTQSVPLTNPQLLL